MQHFHIERKRAAVAVFGSVKRLRTEHGARWLDPVELASIAAGGASRTRIYEWLGSDLSDDAQAQREEARGRPSDLSEDQKKLLVGFAASTRSCLLSVHLSNLTRFCDSYLTITPSLPTLSRTITAHGFSSQKTLTRNSRMVSEEVVEDALSAIEEIRSYHFPPHRIICMDETGLWSNVAAPQTYHFTNWSAILLSSSFCPLLPLTLSSPLLSSPPPSVLMSAPFSSHVSFIRNNAVVRETGDKFRDTVALTVRGDGVDIPPFIIVHTYKNASAASGRRCAGGETPIKGMNTERMIDYIDHIARYVQTTSLLVMDRLSSHTAAQVRRHMETKLSPTGERLIIPIYLPPKSAFLISPLDMGTISAFKAHYYTFDRSSIPLKLRAVTQAWAAVSNEAIRNICLNCGIVGEESIASLRQRFMKEVVGSVPPELEQFLDFYDAWKSGYINVEGATRGRGVTFETPQQLSEAHLDGAYWTNFGRQSSHR